MSEHVAKKVRPTLLAWIAIMGSAALAPTFARAEADLRKISCKEFDAIMQSKDSRQEVAGALLLGFLWGLYKGDDEPPVAGDASDNAKAAKLGKYCTEHPDASLVKAAEKAWEKK
jgi:hypothetical protein